MMNCKRAAELICEGLDRPLSLRERAALRFHLWMCHACKAFDAQNRALLELFERRFRDAQQADADDHAPRLPDDACERLKNRLRNAMQEPPTAK